MSMSFIFNSLIINYLKGDDLMSFEGLAFTGGTGEIWDALQVKQKPLSVSTRPPHAKYHYIH